MGTWKPIFNFVFILLSITVCFQAAGAATLAPHSPTTTSIKNSYDRYFGVAFPYIGEKNLRTLTVQYGAGITKGLSMFAQSGLYKYLNVSDGRYLQTTYELALGKHFSNHGLDYHVFIGGARGEYLVSSVAKDTLEALTFNKYFSQLNMEAGNKRVKIITAFKIHYFDVQKYQSANYTGKITYPESTKGGWGFELAPKFIVRLYSRLSIEAGAGFARTISSSDIRSIEKFWSFGLSYRQ